MFVGFRFILARYSVNAHIHRAAGEDFNFGVDAVGGSGEMCC